MRWRNTRRGRESIGRGGKSRGKKKKKYAAESVENPERKGKETRGREKGGERENATDTRANVCTLLHMRV